MYFLSGKINSSVPAKLSIVRIITVIQTTQVFECFGQRIKKPTTFFFFQGFCGKPDIFFRE